MEVLARIARGGDRDKLAEERLQALAEVVADGQHHDAITGKRAVRLATCKYIFSLKAGTSMQHVVYDLHKRLAASAAATFAAAVAPSLSSLLSLKLPSPLQPCPLLNASICPPSSSSPFAFTLVVYNSHKHSQTMRVRLPVSISRSTVKREGGGDVLASLMPCWWCEQREQKLLHVIADVEAMSSVVVTVVNADEHRDDDVTEAAATPDEGGKAFAIETMTNGIISIDLSLDPATPLFLRNIDSNVSFLVPRPKRSMNHNIYTPVPSGDHRPKIRLVSLQQL